MRVRRRLADWSGEAAYRMGVHRALLRDRAAIAVFHRVDDRYPHDPITVGTKIFREYCTFFARHFQVCSLESLLSSLVNGAPLGGRLVITFDDGYRDNHQVAAPILESLGLTACFFITTSFIGSRVTPWWDREQGIESEWMSWEEVRGLRDKGHEIGAHTVTHVDLGKAHGEQAREEITASRRVLEQRLGEPVRFFAYPYGRTDQLSEANRKLVQEDGYVCCASSHGGLVTPSTSPWSLPRCPVVTWFAGPGDFGGSLLRAR